MLLVRQLACHIAANGLSGCQFRSVLSNPLLQSTSKWN
jgi:hypothetical protein